MNPMLIPMIMFNKMKPSNMTTMILMMSISLNLFMYTNTLNKWFPMILTLIFSGSILILFSLFSSISPNIQMKTNIISMSWVLIIPILIMKTNKFSIPINHISPSISYQTEMSYILIITSMLTTLTMLTKSHIIKLLNPLKSSI